MSTAELRLSYRPDDEWNGQIDVSVVSGTFAGRASAWFGRDALKESFVRALRAFPFSTANPPVMEGGFGNSAKGLDQRHVRVVIRPFDARGALIAQVELATPSSTSPDKDQQQSLTARFLVEYNALETFASDLEDVLDGKRDVAVLLGFNDSAKAIP